MKIFSFLLLAGVCTLTACQSNGKKNPEDVLKAAAKTPGMNAGVSKFNIDAPAGWQKLDTNMNGVKFTFLLAPSATNGFRANVNVISQSMDGSSVNDYFDKSIASMGQYLQHYTAGAKGEKEINGLPAKWMLYSQMQNGLDLDGAFYILPKDGIAYIITLTVSKGQMSQYQAAFDEALHSFQVVN